MRTRFAVEIAGATVGYLSREDALRFATGLEKADRRGARVRCAAKIVGGWRRSKHDVGAFGVYLALKWPMKFAG